MLSNHLTPILWTSKFEVDTKLPNVVFNTVMFGHLDRSIFTIRIAVTSILLSEIGVQPIVLIA